MDHDRVSNRIFSLDEAGRLLPRVKAVTTDAVTRVEVLTAQIQALPSTHPTRARLNAEIEQAIRAWTGEMQEMGLQCKGLWLVDFDNGDGYYCWCYPEEAIAHFHAYDDGFAGRMKIV